MTQFLYSVMICIYVQYIYIYIDIVIFVNSQEPLCQFLQNSLFITLRDSKLR